MHEVRFIALVQLSGEGVATVITNFEPRDSNVRSGLIAVFGEYVGAATIGVLPDSRYKLG